MKKYYFFKIICTTILLALMVYCIYEILLNNAEKIINFSIAFAGLLIYCCILIFTSEQIKKMLLDTYEKNYGKLLDNTFSADKKNRKLFIKSIFFAATQRFIISLNLLKKVAGNCSNSHDEDVVLTVLKTCVINAKGMKNQNKCPKVFLAAISVYKAFINCHIPQHEIFLEISSLYSSLEDYDHSIEYALKAYELDNTDFRAAFALSVFYIKTKDSENAEKYRKIAAKLNGDEETLKHIFSLVEGVSE